MCCVGERTPFRGCWVWGASAIQGQASSSQGRRGEQVGGIPHRITQGCGCHCSWGGGVGQPTPGQGFTGTERAAGQAVTGLRSDPRPQWEWVAFGACERQQSWILLGQAQAGWSTGLTAWEAP